MVKKETQEKKQPSHSKRRDKRKRKQKKEKHLKPAKTSNNDLAKRMYMETTPRGTAKPECAHRTSSPDLGHTTPVMQMKPVLLPNAIHGKITQVGWDANIPSTPNPRDLKGQPGFGVVGSGVVRQKILEGLVLVAGVPTQEFGVNGGGGPPVLFSKKKRWEIALATPEFTC